MPWDPQCYARFQAEREAPFTDLLSLLRPAPGMRAIDLGCGPGQLTARLFESLPEARLTGLDSSPEMLEKARPLQRPGLNFRLGRVEELAGSYDLIFSHAALQWVDDHERLFPRLVRHLAPGGQLAVQMPSNHDHPSHRAILETAAEEPFVSALKGWSRLSPVLPLRRYAEILHASGAVELVALEKVYPHLLPDSDAMVEWVRGTALVPYLERLEPGLQEAFLERCRFRLGAQFSERPVFYGFNRILLWGCRSVD
ncbi:MAG: trans-aconitate 2-methyltransferase [Candidatus Xenobia bacterium]